MKRYVRTQYIPDLTERFPEGLDGPDMYEPRDPEEAFWKTVDEAEQKDEPVNSYVNFYWVGYWLQDGNQLVATIAVPSYAVSDYDYIENTLLNVYGDSYGDIADYGENGTGTLLNTYDGYDLILTDSNQYIVISPDGFVESEIDATDDESAIEQFHSMEI